MDITFEQYKEKHTRAELALLPEVSGFVRNSFGEFGASNKICGQMDIVTEEIFTNISSYAYSADAAEKPVDIVCGKAGEFIHLIFSDKGVPYNPLEKADPVIGIADEMTIGGYGIFMVKNIVDDIEYKYVYEEGKNILNMRKKIQ